jgi:hypothetical protein
LPATNDSGATVRGATQTRVRIHAIFARELPEIGLASCRTADRGNASAGAIPERRALSLACAGRNGTKVDMVEIEVHAFRHVLAMHGHRRQQEQGNRRLQPPSRSQYRGKTNQK